MQYPDIWKVIDLQLNFPFYIVFATEVCRQIFRVIINEMFVVDILSYLQKITVSVIVT